jgi:SAM-dependent methyltransferase
MRKITREFTEMVVAEIPLPAPVVEIGSRQVEGHPELSDLRPLFPGKEFIGCDMLEGMGVDRIENIHKLTFEDNSVGTLIMLDTLEHVQYPFKAMEEVKRVLKPDGIVIMSSVMLCEIHGYPHDYWRFTPQGFETLLENFAALRVYYDLPEKYPRSVFGIGFNQSIAQEELDALDESFRVTIREKAALEPALSVVDTEGDLHLLTRRKARGKLLFLWRRIVNWQMAMKGKQKRL